MSRIYKGDLTANFSIVKRAGFEDERLSWKAKGILAYLLTRPEGWQTYLKQLEKVSTDGRESTANGVKELQALGYMVKKARKNEEGKFEGWDWFVYGDPGRVETEIRLSRNSESPKLGKAVIDKKKEEKKKEEKKSKYTLEFEKFWELYQKHGTKATAARRWNALSEKDRQQILTMYLPAYNQYCKETDWYHRKYAEGWLNGEMWRKDWRSFIKAPKGTTPATSIKAAKGVSSI